MAQNSSGFSSALARTTWPLAMTTSAAATLSRASPYFLTFQPMPPVKRQPADTDALGIARGDRQAMRGQRRRDLTPGGAAADPHEMAFAVDDLHVRELAEVDHDAAVVGAEAREAMAAASHGQHKPGTGGEPDTCLHVPDAAGPQDMGRITRCQSASGQPIRTPCHPVR